MDKPSFKWLLFILLSIVIITSLHYLTSIYQVALHEFYRKLYYIPIILAAFKFRLKGGIIIPLITGILYAPHLLFYMGDMNIHIINQFTEIFLFFVIGIITGVLVEHQHYQSIQLQNQIDKLVSLESETDNILQSIQNGVIAFNHQLQITKSNEEAKRLITADSQQEVPINFFANHHLTPKMLQVMNNGRPLRLKQTDNILPSPVRIHLYPLKEISQKPKGLVMVLEDLKEIQQLEEQVHRAERLFAIGQLASGIAHEIRNPLGIIKTICQGLQNETDIDELYQGLEVIEDEVQRTNGVIEELLDFARPKPNNLSSLDVKELFKDINLLVNNYAKQHRVSLYIDYPSTLPTIIGDREKLKQALINVIFNGIQAMPHGGNLNIKLRHQDENIIIDIIDQGEGIQDTELAKIFNPFYTTKAQGTGLGLAVTHKIIEQHAGQIMISSQTNKGTTIQIKLPITDT